MHTTSIRQTILSLLVAGTVVGSTAACSIADLVDVERPDSGIVDENYILTYEGAVAAKNGTIGLMALGFVGSGRNSFVETVGLFTDELRESLSGSRLDGRVRELNGIGPVHDTIFGTLQKVRVGAAQARWALRRHTTTPDAFLSEMYGLEGYAVLFLAEIYCSGIPLTRVEHGRQFVYTAGFTTEEVLRHAIALFDSAYALAGDSVSLKTLAQVGKGRALLNLGQYRAAAEAVTGVPDNATYTFKFLNGGDFLTRNNFVGLYINGSSTPIIVNQKGTNGLNWVAPATLPQDPRIPLDPVGPRQKVYTSGDSPAILASGVEARLIEAEWMLQPENQPGNAWLTALNNLRARLQGTGGVRLLQDTTDPGTQTGRVNLLFRERAFWLYLTGHRQGDLRRLVRRYDRVIDEVYPAGPYAPTFTGNTWIAYGLDVTLEPGNPERLRNPLYQGCTDRNA